MNSLARNGTRALSEFHDPASPASVVDNALWLGTGEFTCERLVGGLADALASLI